MNIHFKARIPCLCAHFVPEKFPICFCVTAVPPRHVLRLSEFLVPHRIYFPAWQEQEVQCGVWGGSVGGGGVLTWLGAARVSTDCRMWQERREGSAALPQGLAQNATPKCNTDRGS